MSKSSIRTLFSKMSNEIILYDLPSTAKCACWSLNPWKGMHGIASILMDCIGQVGDDFTDLLAMTARLALNYKGLPYKTEWVEYPDLKGRFMELGIAASRSCRQREDPGEGLFEVTLMLMLMIHLFVRRPLRQSQRGLLLPSNLQPQRWEVYDGFSCYCEGVGETPGKTVPLLSFHFLQTNFVRVWV